MQKIMFSAYAIPTGGYAGQGVGNADHTFILTSQANNITDPKQISDDWGCWGRGEEALAQPGVRLVAQGPALAEWGRAIYGTDPNLPTNLIQRVEGVCQNACNRLLALVGKDVSAASAYMYVILLYGKYGFHLQDFVQKIQDAAAQINAANPGAISDSDLQTVLSRFGEDPADELGTLESHFTGALPTTLTSAQNSQLLNAYRGFQAQRQQIFDQQWPNRNDPNFQTNLASQLEPLFLQCLKNFSEILGPDQFQVMFKVPPDQALPYLLGH